VVLKKATQMIIPGYEFQPSGSVVAVNPSNSKIEKIVSGVEK